MKHILQIIYHVYIIALLVIYGGTIIYCSIYNYHAEPDLPLLVQILLLTVTLVFYLSIESKVGIACSVAVLIVQTVYYVFAAQILILPLLVLLLITKRQKLKKRVIVILVIILLYVLIFQLAVFMLEGSFMVYQKTVSILSPIGSNGVFYTEFYSFGKQRRSFLSYGSNDSLNLVLLRIWRNHDTQLQTFENELLKDIVIEWKNDTNVYLNGILYTIN